MIDTGDPRVDGQAKLYEQQLQEAVAKALTGQISKRELERELLRLSTDNTMAMFLLGGGNINNPNAQKWLEKQRQVHIKSAKTLARDVFSGKYTVEDEQTNRESSE